MPDGGVPEWSNGAVEPAAARDAGVDAYMTKPVSVRALYHYVVAFMARSARDALVVGARPSRARRRSPSTAVNTNMSAGGINGALS